MANQLLNSETKTSQCFPTVSYNSYLMYIAVNIKVCFYFCASAETSHFVKFTNTTAGIVQHTGRGRYIMVTVTHNLHSCSHFDKTKQSNCYGFIPKCMIKKCKQSLVQ